MQIVIWGIAITGLLLLLILSYIVFLMLKQNLKFYGEMKRDKFRKNNYSDGTENITEHRHNSIDRHLLHMR